MLSLTSPVAAVNPECHLDECREILGTTYERHCILDAVGEASVKLVTESLFVVTNQSAVVVEFDEVLVDMVMFAHAKSVKFTACFIFLIGDAKLDMKFRYKNVVMFTHAELVKFMVHFIFLIGDAKLDMKFRYEKTIVFTPQWICIVAH